MATRTNYFIQGVLDLIYRNVALPNIGDTTGLRATSVPGNLYVALWTDSAEADYTGYTRMAVSRLNEFSRSGNVISNANQITFPKATAGTNTITKAAIYDAATNGNQLHLQTLPTEMIVSTNVTPYIEAGQLTITGS